MKKLLLALLGAAVITSSFAEKTLIFANNSQDKITYIINYKTTSTESNITVPYGTSIYLPTDAAIYPWGRAYNLIPAQGGNAGSIIFTESQNKAIFYDNMDHPAYKFFSANSTGQLTLTVQ